MSPRRSSRARSSAHPPPPPSQTASSTSTSTMKNTRAAQRSQSIDDPNPDDDASQSQVPTSEPVMPRRSRRNGGEDITHNRDAKMEDDEELDVNDEAEPEEEITRCICGQADYPGPTPHAREMARAIDALESLGDDLGNFFVQCDRCGVWQHGGCMGLVDEQNLPDQYFCEQCKPDLHKVVRGSNGVKSSRYLPVLQAPSSRSSSLSSSEQRKKEKNRQSENTKRRATMNSRGAYDEDEMLRLAIEESREMRTLGKRTREDGDDSKPPVKRQRTGSSSSETASKRSQSPATIDGIPTRTGTKSKQNLRGAAAKNTREREMRDKQKEQAAAARAEAASKRHARSERRRGEDSPPPTPSRSPSKHLAATTGPANGKSTAGTPTPTPGPAVKAKFKAARAAPSRRGRLGRNQYTRERDRDLNGVESDTPMRDTSHDRYGNSGANGNGNGNGIGTGTGNSPLGYERINGESGRSSKAKTHPARTSMNEMKRRVAAILEFVGQLQTQTQRGSAGSGGSSGKNGGGTPNANASANGENAAVGVAGLVKAVQDAVQENGAAGDDAGDEQEGGGGGTGMGQVKLKLREDAEFKGMASAVMMETLTRELVGWQRVYGFYSR